MFKKLWNHPITVGDYILISVAAGVVGFAYSAAYLGAFWKSLSGTSKDEDEDFETEATEI